MDNPEAIIAVAGASVAGLIFIGLLVARITCAREFAVFFGLKLKSTPKVKSRVVRQKPVDDLEITVQNPIVVLRDKKEALKKVEEVHPLKVTRIRKEFSGSRALVS